MLFRVMKFRSHDFFLILTLLVVFITSSAVVPLYIYGDQLHYRNVYESIVNFSFFDSFSYYVASLGSREPGYFISISLLSNLGVPKDYFVIVANVIFSYYSYLALRQVGAHPLVAFVLVSFSYYSFVLFFAAERLKFSILFFFVVFSIKKGKNIAIFLSLIFHVQVAILYASLFFVYVRKFFIDLFFRFKLSRSDLKLFLFCFLVFVVVFTILRTHIESKFESYYSGGVLSDLYKVLIFMLLSLFYAKRKSNVVFCFLPLLFSVFIFGDNRINIFGYFLFLYFSLHNKGGFNSGVILTTMYYLYTGYLFLCNIVYYGNGYADLQ